MREVHLVGDMVQVKPPVSFPPHIARSQVSLEHSALDALRREARSVCEARRPTTNDEHRQVSSRRRAVSLRPSDGESLLLALALWNSQRHAHAKVVGLIGLADRLLIDVSMRQAPQLSE